MSTRGEPRHWRGDYHGLPRQGPRVDIGRGVATARAMFVPTARAVRLAMAAYDDTIGRMYHGSPPTASPTTSVME